MNSRISEVIIRPVYTEKSSAAEGLLKYTFLVKKDANKTEIAQAFYHFFKTKPVGVNIVRSKAKDVRTGTKYPGVKGEAKKAIITVTQAINFGAEEQSGGEK